MFSFSLPRRVPPRSVHVVGQQTKNQSFSEIKTIFKFDVRENKDHSCTREHIRVMKHLYFFGRHRASVKVHVVL